MFFLGIISLMKILLGIGKYIHTDRQDPCICLRPELQRRCKRFLAFNCGRRTCGMGEHPLLLLRSIRRVQSRNPYSSVLWMSRYLHSSQIASFCRMWELPLEADCLLHWMGMEMVLLTVIPWWNFRYCGDCAGHRFTRFCDSFHLHRLRTDSLVRCVPDTNPSVFRSLTPRLSYWDVGYLASNTPPQ